MSRRLDVDEALLKPFKKTIKAVMTDLWTAPDAEPEALEKAAPKPKKKANKGSSQGVSFARSEGAGVTSYESVMQLEVLQKIVDREGKLNALRRHTRGVASRENHIGPPSPQVAAPTASSCMSRMTRIPSAWQSRKSGRWATIRSWSSCPAFRKPTRRKPRNWSPKRHS